MRKFQSIFKDGILLANFYLIKIISFISSSFLESSLIELIAKNQSFCIVETKPIARAGKEWVKSAIDTLKKILRTVSNLE